MNWKTWFSAFYAQKSLNKDIFSTQKTCRVNDNYYFAADA